MASEGASLTRAMLGALAHPQAQARFEARGETPRPRPVVRPAPVAEPREPDPRDTLLLIEDAGEAFAALQSKLLTIVQNARVLIDEASQERAQHRGEIDTLDQEMRIWSARALKAEESLGQASELLQMQQRMVEEAIAREREALQRCRRLELKLSQLSF
jgi:hypothetical protein